MALNNKQILIGSGLMAAASIWMGYTMLFPNTVSRYATLSAEEQTQTPSVTIVEPVTKPSDVLSEVSSPVSQAHESPAKIELSSSMSDGELNARIQSLLEKHWQGLLAKPSQVVEPLQIDTDALAYLQKSSDLAGETLDAQIRDQKSRGQGPQALKSGLGLDYQQPINTPVKKTALMENSTKKVEVLPVTLGSIIESDGQFFARIYYKNRWHRMTSGDKTGNMVVQAVSADGVNVRINGTRHFLRLGGDA